MTKLLSTVCLILIFVSKTLAQVDRRPNLKTNARDTVMIYEMFSTADGLGDGTMRIKKLGKNYVYPTPAIDVTPAEFPGGDDVFHKFLTDNIHLPKNGKFFKLIMSFIIEYNGKLSNIRIIHSFDQEATDQALKLLKLQRWTPAIKDNKFVRSEITTQIWFQPKD
jgi:hypothetical protein